MAQGGNAEVRQLLPEFQLHATSTPEWKLVEVVEVTPTHFQVLPQACGSSITLTR